MFPQNLQTDDDIEALKPSGSSYKKFIGRSLFILVQPTGRKYWRFKYRFDGKAKTLALGVFPQISISTAIKARDDAKKMLGRGIDPMLVRHEEKDIKKEMSKIPIFRMNIADSGELTIQNNSSSIKLTKSQTEALKLLLTST